MRGTVAFVRCAREHRGAESDAVRSRCWTFVILDRELLAAGQLELAVPYDARVIPKTLLVAIALSLLACGTPPSDAPVSNADPSRIPVPPTPTPAPSIPTPPSPPSAEPSVAPERATPTGLPEVTFGPAIRLESTLPTTTREVFGKRLPSVTLANATAQANLDAWFADHAWCRGRVQLAIEGFISYVCSYSEPAAGSGSALASMSVRISENGAVAAVEPADIFLPGTDVQRMACVWADDPDAPLGEVAFGPAGAMIVPTDSDDRVQLPWRTIAPYIRSDGPLGPVLIAHGLTLAAAGTRAPPTPSATNALRFADPNAAMKIAARLPVEIRGRTRLRVGRDESLLLFPPDAVPSALGPPGELRPVQRYMYGALAELVLARVRSAVEIHAGAGPHTPVLAALPTGSVVVAARGAIGGRVSELGTGWVLVGGANNGGYVQGHGLTPVEACGVPVASPGALGGNVHLAAGESFAWTLAKSADGAHTELALFPVRDCVIGQHVRSVSVDGTVTDLQLVRATASGPEWLLVVVTAADLAVPARVVAVYGAASESAALYSAMFDAPVVRLAERRGPDRAAGYFPVTIASGSARTWLTWNGSAVEVVAP